MRVVLLSLFLVTGCATYTYTYIDLVPAETRIDKPLYLISVPPLSVFHAYPAKNADWERYRRDGRPDDLILKEGYPHSSYAATVEVKRRPRNVRTAEELKRHVAINLKRKSPVIVQVAQSNLICVKPQVYVERVSDRPFFAVHSMSCIDTNTDRYYDLIVSYLTKRKKGAPSRELEEGAQYFFNSFRVKVFLPPDDRRYRAP